MRAITRIRNYRDPPRTRGRAPSALGHSITLRAMRRFQRLGHHVIVVVGTMTAMVGATLATGWRDVRALWLPT